MQLSPSRRARCERPSGCEAAAQPLAVCSRRLPLLGVNGQRSSVRTGRDPNSLRPAIAHPLRSPLCSPLRSPLRSSSHSPPPFLVAVHRARSPARSLARPSSRRSVARRRFRRYLRRLLPLPPLSPLSLTRRSCRFARSRSSPPRSLGSARSPPLGSLASDRRPPLSRRVRSPHLLAASSAFSPRLVPARSPPLLAPRGRSPPPPPPPSMVAEWLSGTAGSPARTQEHRGGRMPCCGSRV